MTDTRKPKPEVVISRPNCPFCDHPNFVKTGGAYHKQPLPNGGVSKLFRVRCKECGGGFRLREITKAATS